MIKFTKNHFKTVKSVEWSDVIKKLAVEFDSGSVNFIAEGKEVPPTFAMHSNYYPGSITNAYEEVKDVMGINEMHIYTSLGSKSSTYGKHKDTMDVLIVAAIGSIIYKFDNDLGRIGRKSLISHTLDPGDSVFIPKGFYHEPQVVEPRVTLSFSWPS